MPFFAIYFQDQLGLSAGFIGLGFLLQSVMGVFAVLAGGYITDKFGRRKLILVSILSCAGTNLLFPLVGGAGSYLLVSLLLGGCLALYFPASLAILTDLSAPEERARVFGWLRIAVNSGLGLGYFGGAITVDWVGSLSDDPALPYHMLFYADAVTYVLFFFVVLAFLRESLSPQVAREYQGFRQGWGKALRDSRLMALALINICFTSCYSLFMVGFPTFFKDWVGLGAMELSIVLGLSTFMVVFLQAPLWSFVDAWPRTRAMALSALLFAAGLLTFNFCALGALNGFVVTLLAMVIVTAGEIFHGPAVTSLFANLAPAHLRGTYMSVQSMCWNVGLGVGPVVSGAILDAGAPYALWTAYPVALVVAFFGLVAFGKRLPEEVNSPAAESQ